MAEILMWQGISLIWFIITVWIVGRKKEATMRHTYIYDSKHIDVNVARSQAHKRAAFDPHSRTEREATMIHFHGSSSPCNNLMHERVSPDPNGDGIVTEHVIHDKSKVV